MFSVNVYSVLYESITMSDGDVHANVFIHENRYKEMPQKGIKTKLIILNTLYAYLLAFIKRHM